MCGWKFMSAKRSNINVVLREYFFMIFTKDVFSLLCIISELWVNSSEDVIMQITHHRKVRIL